MAIPGGSTFTERILEIYDRSAPHQIHPFIGDAFLAPDDTRLRVMVVGINAYVSERDRAAQSPAWFPAWFREQRDRFHKGVWRDVGELSRALVAPPCLFEGKTLDGRASLYVTNAVKEYVPEAQGKRADQIPPEHFTNFLPAWYAELEVMADSGAFPHVIAIVGAPFWGHACRTFQPSTAPPGLGVQAYRMVAGPCLHFVNRITRLRDGTLNDTLLVRLRHPAARTRAGSPAWLLDDERFQAVSR